MPIDLLVPPNRIPIHFSKQFKKSVSEPEISDINFENNSSREFSGQAETTPSSHKPKKSLLFEKFSKIKDLRWKYFFMEIALKHFCVFSILILMIQIQNHTQQYIYCKLDTLNFPLVFYTIFRDMVFATVYYLLFAYYAFNSCWPLATDKKAMIISLLITTFFYVLKVYNIDPYGNNLDIYVVSLIVQSLRVIAVYGKQLCLWENMKSRIFPFFALIGFCLLFNYYMMKRNLIPSLKEKLSFKFGDYSISGNIIFQAFLFVYFRIYYNFFFQILIKYANLQNDSGFGKNCLVMFSKYFLIDAVCSSTPAAIIGSLQSIGTWLGFFNFVYQVLVLYDSNYDILKNVKMLFFKLCKKKPPKLNRQEEYVKEILSISLSPVLVIIFLHLILWFSFGKAMDRWTLTINCDFSLKEFVVIRIENISILAVFIFLLVVGLATKDHEPLRLEWELETYGFRFNIIYYVMLHFVVDNHLQYYFSFYYLKIN